MMTMEQFQEEKARLVALYGDGAREASGKRAQALAQLYARSGWTQRALAEQERLSFQRICQLLTFGQFLIFLSTQGRQNPNLFEKQFRLLWHATDKTQTDTQRFAEMARSVDEQHYTHSGAGDPGATRRLGKQIVAQFADGKWHPLQEIADTVDSDIVTVRTILDRIVTQGTFHTFAEKRPAGKGSYAYRLVKGGKKKIDLTVFHTETKPILDDMEKVINGHQVHFSQQAMKMAFAQFRNAIERLAR